MIERTFLIGAESRMVATLCLPDGAGKPAATGLMLFNSGMIGRIGPHRLNVHVARQAASKGVASLRFDLRGVGDSERARGDKEYQAQAVEDIREAMEAFSAHAGISRFVLFGFCSGAYHGMNAAQEDERIAGVITFDGYQYRTFRSTLNRRLASVRHFGLMRAVTRRLARMFSAAEAHPPTGPATGSVSYVTQTPDRAGFAELAGKLVERGMRLAMIFSGGNDTYNYAGQFQDAFRDYPFAGKVSSFYFEDWDHVATRLAHHAQLVELVVRLVAEEAAARR
jgi:pimeloyl-ACP methyl ester carboxylesterase